MKNVRLVVFVLFFVFCAIQSFSQTKKQKVISDIKHFMSLYNSTINAELIKKIHDFSTVTDIQIYTKCLLNDTTLFAKVLNGISELKDETKEGSYICFAITFSPSINSAGNKIYGMQTMLETSQDLIGFKDVFNPITREVNNLLSKRNYMLESSDSSIIKGSLIAGIDSLQILLALTDSIIAQDTIVNTNISESFGPITCWFDSIPNSVKTENGFYCFENVNGALLLKCRNSQNRGNSFLLKGASISFKKHKRRNDFKDVSIVWKEGSQLALDTNTLLTIALKEVDISVDEGGKLSGNLKMYFSDKKQVRRKGLFGINADTDAIISFDYAMKNNFDGRYDYSAVKNLTLSLCIGETIISKPQAIVLSNEAKANVVIGVKKSKSWNNGGFILQLENFSMECLFDLHEEVEIINASGKAIVDGVKGVSGEFECDLNWSQDEFFARAINIPSAKFYGMEMKQSVLEIYFENDLSILGIRGSCELNHPKFNKPLRLLSFEIEKGVVLDFDIESVTLRYNGFRFGLQDFRLSEDTVFAKAKLSLDLTGKAFEIDLNEIKIDSTAKVHIDEINGQFNFSQLSMRFNAQFLSQGFSGDFNASYLNKIDLMGAIIFGAESDYNYAYLKLNTKTHIPLPVGLSLSKIGGEGGYNYSLQYNKQYNQFTGKAEKGKYLIGFSLGVSDLSSSLFQINANPIIQFGNSEVELFLNASVKMPIDNPLVNGELNAYYNLNTKILRGDCNVQLMIPSNSGRVLSANPMLDFRIENNSWEINGNISATVFSTLQYTGNVSLKRSLSTNSTIIGRMDGLLEYQYDYALNNSLFMDEISINGEIEINLNAGVILDIEEKGFEGEFNASLYGYGQINIVAFGKQESAEIRASANGVVSYYQNVAKVIGDLQLEINSAGYSSTINCSLSYALDNNI